jgi:hypothetical protein
VATVVAAAQGVDRSPLDRVTAYVEEYYGRAQRLMVNEVVTLEHLRSDLTPSGPPRRLEYELRVEWNPEGAEPRASVVRQLVKVGSRPAKPGREPECLDPKGVSPEPLAFLLADRRGRFVFRDAGAARTAGRQAMLFHYSPARSEEPTVTGDKECISIDMPMRTRGRVWVDPETFAVLRLEEGIVGVTDVRVPRALQTTAGWGAYVTVERSDTTTRYQRVRFSDPDEAILLPESIESVSVIRSAGIQRLRMTQRYRDYRRFLTASRIVPPGTD